MQAAANTDLDVETALTTLPALPFQLTGIVVEQDERNCIVLYVYRDVAGLKIFAASFADLEPTVRVNAPIDLTGPVMLRLTRMDDVWLAWYAAVGGPWQRAVTFSHTLEVRKTGPFAANAGVDAPAFTSTVDYFFNRIAADPSVDDPPVARDDEVETDGSTPVRIEVLLNDTDPDDAGLAVGSFTDPANGSVVDDGDGTLTYTADAGFSGSDSFDYTATDGHGGAATATVTVTVHGGDNTAPAAVGDTARTDEDTPVSIAVLANDSDVDGDALSVQSVTSPSPGSAVLNLDGTVTYTPAPDSFGEDSFTYRLRDARGGTATATVLVTVVPVNDPPVCTDDGAATEAAASVTIAVLDNDTDVDGDRLTVVAVEHPEHGEAAANQDGTVTYTAPELFQGIDRFAYTVEDGNGASATGNVAVTVGQAGGVRFVRGDVNVDGIVNIADPIFVLGVLFQFREDTTCRSAADGNDDGIINIADAIRLLGFLFKEQVPLPEPYGSCGTDPTSDALGCESFSRCAP